MLNSPVVRIRLLEGEVPPRLAAAAQWWLPRQIYPAAASRTNPLHRGTRHEETASAQSNLRGSVGRPGRSGPRGIAPGALQGGDGGLQAVGPAGPAAGVDPSPRRCLCRPRPRFGRQGHVQGSRDGSGEHHVSGRDDPRAGALPDLADSPGPAPESGTDGAQVGQTSAGGRRRPHDRTGSSPGAHRAGAARDAGQRSGGRPEPRGTSGTHGMAPRETVR